MKIKDMFQKEIERPMSGVVQVNQNGSDRIARELEEYIVTDDLERSLGMFFEYYCKSIRRRASKTGVWVSGDYGSGKSYFLKILSCLLSGESYGGRDAVSYMESKINHKQIISNIRRASKAHTTVVHVIFSMEDRDGNGRDAIVRAFTNGFNEMRGFCGSTPWIADLEYQMTKEGVYGAFRERFKGLSGSEWERAREDFYFEEENVVMALSDAAHISLESARVRCGAAEKNYSASSETFSDRVNEYIRAESEGGGKRFVTFICDNAEMVIRDNGSRMLGLQTLVEELEDRCGGQAWVVIAAQRDMDAFAGTSGDGGLKLRDRFGVCISLSCPGAEEIIKRKLLRKTGQGAAILRDMYYGQSEALKKLIPPMPGLTERKDRCSETDFVELYPFLPYQFDLLQASLEGFRSNTETVLPLPGGIRTLLNLFQEEAIRYQNCEEGTLVPFQSFYGEIESFLDSDTRAILSKAGDWAKDPNGPLKPFDMEVLKILVMIKSIPDVLPPASEHIATVMLCHVNQDKDELRKNVDASLHRLSEQHLAVEYGGLFMFQNTREQDINRKIGETAIDEDAVVENTRADIRKLLLGSERVFHYGGHYDFPLNIIMDHQPCGAQGGELGIHILTRDCENARSLSDKENNVIVSMGGASDFLEERRQSLRIDAYIRRTSGKTYSGMAQKIRNAKVEESRQRIARCRELIGEALSHAHIYVRGDELDLEEREPSRRVKEACGVLVEGIYTKLNYITHFYCSIHSLWEILETGNKITGRKKDHPEPNQRAAGEMMEYIRRMDAACGSLTVKGLMDHFGRTPYGWKPYDIAGVALILFKKQEVWLELNGRPVDMYDRNIIVYVTEPELYDRIAVAPRIKIKKELLENAREIAASVFQEADGLEDENRLMACMKASAQKALYCYDMEKPGIRQLLGEHSGKPYPGKRVLEKSAELLENLIGREDIRAFFNYLWEEKKTFLDCGRDLQTVRNFFVSQREVFDKALDVTARYEKEHFYLREDEIIQIVEKIRNIIRVVSPYTEIGSLEKLTERFQARYREILAVEREGVSAEIEAAQKAVFHDLENRGSRGEYNDRAKEVFTELRSRLSHADTICEVVAMGTESVRIRDGFLRRSDDREEIG